MRLSLQHIGALWVLLAAGAALMAGLTWAGSSAAWQAHLTRAETAGAELYYALRGQIPAPEGLRLTPLIKTEASAADRGAFSRISGTPRPALISHIPVRMEGGRLSLAVVSSELRYAAADLETGSGPAAVGALMRQMARYPTDTVLFARPGDAGWIRVEGTGIWGPQAAPRDLRLLAAIGLALALIGLMSHVAETSAGFDRIARTLWRRASLGVANGRREAGGGPAELHEIREAVNTTLEAERAQIAARAEMLSGMSHDLGTPATRLRLRAELIEDETLREKLVTDIDRMTGMIDSMLTYSRAEMAEETPRRLSLSALVGALVDDYQDTGAPVRLAPAPDIEIKAGSLLGMRMGHRAAPQDAPVLVMARPLALQRAIGNLIDNALKYGRHANVTLTADAAFATISVEDAGQNTEAAEMEALTAPFRRGANSDETEGYGLGLTIVAGIARQHGGSLRYQDGHHGLRALFTICRNLDPE